MAFQFFLRDANAGYGVTDVVSGRVRLGELSGLTTRAEKGIPGMDTVRFEDPAGTINFLDGLVHAFAAETTCPTTRMYYGFTTTRSIARDLPAAEITGPARRWDVSMTDLNAFLSCRVCRPSGGSSRPAETDIARITWLLGTVYLLSFVFDNGWIDTSNPVTMDATDYTGQFPDAVLRDCADASGKNYYLRYDETQTLGEEIGLVYQLPTSTLFTSTIRLTNVLSQVDNSTTFGVYPDATLEQNPERVYDGVLVIGQGINEYQSQGLVGVVPRDAVIQAPNVRTEAVLAALATKYLADTATEDERIKVKVDLPKAKVNLLMAGDRVSVYFSHLPGYTNPAYTGIACVSRSVAQSLKSNAMYTVTLELCDLKLMASPGSGDEPGPDIQPPPPDGGPVPPEEEPTCDDNLSLGGTVTAGGDQGTDASPDAALNPVNPTYTNDDSLATTSFRYALVAGVGGATKTYRSHWIVDLGSAKLVESAMLLDYSGVSGTSPQTISYSTSGAAGTWTDAAAVITAVAHGWSATFTAQTKRYWRITHSQTGTGLFYIPTLGLTEIQLLGCSDGEIAAPSAGQFVTAGAAVPDPDGTTDDFTTGPFMNGSLVVLLDGIDIWEDVIESDNEAGTFSLTFAPAIGERLRTRYYSQ